MAIIIGIQQQGLLQKPVTLKDILVEDMSYGVYGEGKHLLEKKKGKYTLLYFPKNIQRGFEVLKEKHAVYAKLNVPASEEEIRALFAYARFLCSLLGTDRFLCNDREYGPDDIDALTGYFIDVSVKELWNIRKKINSPEVNSLYIFGAKNPVALGKTEMEEVNGSLERFGKLLHRIQSTPGYYAVPALRENPDGTLTGVYLVNADTDTIFPLVPGDALFLREKPSSWEVLLTDGKEQLGNVSFDTLMSHADISRRYDDRRSILRFTSEELRGMLS